ncbi:MAG: MBL fold metallo-hydrolase [Oscillospiraceae bacterium]|jgi:competence protein ComEC|nr:MBL fold metallo-hydrolase [Oscillospiraceae bacterium]
MSSRKKLGTKAYRSYPKRKRGDKKIAALMTALVLVAVSAFFSLNGKVWNVANGFNWNDIAALVGLTDKSAASIADGEIAVHYLDVGQGDCELIVTPKFSVLIDSGELEYYPRVLNYLARNGVTRLDYIIVTHPHSDHMGGLSYIISSIDTGAVIMPQVSEEMKPVTSVYENLIKSIKSNNIEAIAAVAGTRYELGGGAYFDIVAPVRNDYDNLNDYSVVVRLVHGKNVFLFTGDIEKTAESDILNSYADISADVLKVAHHGSNTSSMADFVEEVGGSMAVIEVGSPNSYGHPTKGTLDTLNKFGYTVYRTDLHGNIVMTSDGEKIDVATAKQTS